MSCDRDRIIPFPQDAKPSSPDPQTPDMRSAVRALLDDAAADVSCPVGVCAHQNGRWRRASLIFGLAGGYGLIITQGLSGAAQLVPACLNFGLMVAAVICMVVADRRDRRR